MTTPRLTVAMSVHDDAPFLRAAIDSILAQSFADFEFLIVDDGSTDGSSEILDAYAAADPRVRVLRQPNRGLIASLNRLIDEARAPYVARMDGDDVALPDRFARQIAFLDAHPDHGVLGTFADDIDTDGRITPRLYPLPHRPDDIVAALATHAPIIHPSVTMRSELVRAAGGYRAAFRHCEDYDLWLRLSEVTRLANLDETLMLYRRSAGQVSVRHPYAQHYGAAVARQAHVLRQTGAPDPTATLTTLPPIEAIDAIFGPGTARAIRADLSASLRWSPRALNDGGFAMVLASMAERGNRDGLWRTAIRLLRFGMPVRALRLAAGLLRSRS